MLQVIAHKRLWIGLAIISFSSAFGMQNIWAAEDTGLGLDTKYSVTNTPTLTQSTADSQNQEIRDLLTRIKYLERQIGYLEQRVDRNMMSGTILNKTKELADDAWTIAVEARAIAVRAEAKADKAQKNQKR